MRFLIVFLAFMLSACSSDTSSNAMPMTDEALSKVNAALSDPDIRDSLKDAAGGDAEEALKVFSSSMKTAFEQSGYSFERTFVELDKDLGKHSSDNIVDYLDTVSMEAVTLMVRAASTIDMLAEKSGSELENYFEPDSAEALRSLAGFY